MQADSDALRRSAGSQPMGKPIGYGFTHDFALCRSAGAVRHFHRLRHAFSVQMVWYLSLTYGQAHRLSSGMPSACLFYTQNIRNGAVHTLFDSFATAPFFSPCCQPDFSCALEARGSGLTVASLPHFMCRLPPSAFRIPPFY